MYFAGRIKRRQKLTQLKIVHTQTPLFINVFCRTNKKETETHAVENYGAFLQSAVCVRNVREELECEYYSCLYLFFFVILCVCVYVCMYVCMMYGVCVCVCVYVCVYVCMYVKSYGTVQHGVCMYGCMHIWMYACNLLRESSINSNCMHKLCLTSVYV